MPNAVDLTKQGIAAYNAGDPLAARDCFARANEADPAYEMAWLWRSSVAENDAEKRAYLEKALTINSASAAARRGLAQLGDVIAAPLERAEPMAPPIVAPEAPEESATKQCPYCAETIQAAAIVCRYCGRELGEKASVPVAAPAEADDRAALDGAIRNYTEQGWQVVSQTETTAQLKKSREWSKAGLILFVALPLLGALFYGPLLYVAIFGLLLIVADYLLKKEHLMFLTAEQLRDKATLPHIDVVEYGRTICSACREYVRADAIKCKHCEVVFASSPPVPIPNPRPGSSTGA